jgi:hypothetical protein
MFARILGHVSQAFTALMLLCFSQVESELIIGLFFISGHIFPFCQHDWGRVMFNTGHKQSLYQSFLKCGYGAMLISPPFCFQ